jgi:hypothetical protein
MEKYVLITGATAVNDQTSEERMHVRQQLHAMPRVVRVDWSIHVVHIERAASSCAKSLGSAPGPRRSGWTARSVELNSHQTNEAGRPGADRATVGTYRGWAGFQAMNGMSSFGIVTNGRIMSRSSCSRMWQWYMYRPL